MTSVFSVSNYCARNFFFWFLRVRVLKNDAKIVEEFLMNPEGMFGRQVHHRFLKPSPHRDIVPVFLWLCSLMARFARLSAREFS